MASRIPNSMQVQKAHDDVAEAIAASLSSMAEQIKKKYGLNDAAFAAIMGKALMANGVYVICSYLGVGAEGAMRLHSRLDDMVDEFTEELNGQPPFPS